MTKPNPLLPQRSPLRDPEETRVEDWYTELSPALKASIERGLADADAGRTVTSEEMWKRYGRTKKG